MEVMIYLFSLKKLRVAFGDINMFSDAVRYNVG